MAATYYHLYVKTYCGFCKKAVELLTKKEKEFIVTLLDHSPSMERAIKRKYKYETVPMIIEVKVETMDINEAGEDKPHADVIREAKYSFIGGYTELEQHLTKERRSLTCIKG